MGAAYEEYLESPHWKALRLRKIADVGRRCQACTSTRKIVVHHSSYSQGLLNTELHHLIVLCDECHNLFHRHIVHAGRRLSDYTTASTLDFLRAWRGRLGKPIRVRKIKPPKTADEKLHSMAQMNRVSKRNRKCIIKTMRQEIGGFTRVNCERLGIPWPLEKGWQKRFLADKLAQPAPPHPASPCER